jgi:hypothetical protein
MARDHIADQWRELGESPTAISRRVGADAAGIRTASHLKIPALPNAPTSRRTIIWARARVLGRHRLLILAVVVALGAASVGIARVVQSAPASTVRAAAVLPSSVVLTWHAPHAAVSAAIFRDGRLLDTVPAASAKFQDGMLWPNQSYFYSVKLLDAAGKTLAVGEASAHTPSGEVTRYFRLDSVWNTPIPPSPAIDPRSAIMVQHALVPFARSANLADSKAWGIPVITASETSHSYDIKCSRFGCHRDLFAKIPLSAVTSSGSDHRLVIVDPNTRLETDLWKATYDARTNTWSAGSRYQIPLDGAGSECAAGLHCQGAVASGFAALAGVTRPEEIAQGHIDHALSLASPLIAAKTIVCPATHTDGRSLAVGALPEGAHIQLDPAFDVEAQNWPSWKKVIARALQKYGAYVTDTSDSLLIRAESSINRGYDAWALAGVPDSPGLSKLPWDQMRVLQMQTC